MFWIWLLSTLTITKVRWPRPCQFCGQRRKTLRPTGNLLSALPLGDIPWEKRIEEGSAAKTIVEHAATIHADAIVMGTHGRSGLEHMLLGSVAEAVARAASCPVLTVRPEAFEFKLP
jgi:Universal stress protein family